MKKIKQRILFFIICPLMGIILGYFSGKGLGYVLHPDYLKHIESVYEKEDYSQFVITFDNGQTIIINNILKDVNETLGE